MRRPHRALVPLLVTLTASLATGCGMAREAAPTQSPASFGGHAEGRTQAKIVSTGSSAMEDESDAMPMGAPSAAAMPAMPAEPAPAPKSEGLGVAPARGPAPSSATSPAKDGGEHQAQLLVYTSRLTLAVYQVETQLAEVERIAKENQGYLAQRGDHQITVRVPRERFQAALDAITKLGDVLHRDVSAEDVTDQFVDLTARLKNARAMQARLHQLLERAAVKEAIEIEKELGRITEEIERIEGKLKLLRDRVAFSTLEVMFQSRGPSLHGRRVALPFPWLGELGLPRLLSLTEEK